VKSSALLKPWFRAIKAYIAPTILEYDAANMMRKIHSCISSSISKTPVLVWMLLGSALLHLVLIFGLKPDARVAHKASVPPVVFRIHLERDVSTTERLATTSEADQHHSLAEEAGLPPNEVLALVPVNPQVLPKFYKARELDVLPKPVGEVPLQYPSTISDVLRSGTVRMEIFIDDDGEVLSLNVIGATLPGVFDQAAMDAFKHQLFEPGLIDGKPVKSHIKLTVGFGKTAEQAD
jgi:TonB family protein